MDVSEIRRGIPALGRTIYFNTGGTGPQPTKVTDEVIEAYRFIMQSGPDAQPVRQFVEDKVFDTRTWIARLLGSDASELTFTRSISEGINIVAWGIDWVPGDEVIITDQEHPSGLLPWYNLRERRGVHVKQLSLSADRDLLLQRLGALITPRTRLLALSHVTAENGLSLPVREISAIAHERQVPVLLDGAQAIGQFRVDLNDLNVDFYAVTGHKWALGGYGAGVLYIRHDVLDQLKVSWTGAGAELSLDRVTGEHSWRPNASRFEFGNRSWPLCIGLGVATEFLHDIGLEEIERRARYLAEYLLDGLSTISGVSIQREAGGVYSPGIVTFAIEGISGDDAVHALWDYDDIVCRAAFQGQAVRISVAFFNIESELNVLLDAVRALANGKQGFGRVSSICRA
jgi:cysteine desulfurase / selenocysteine lyase